MTPRRLNTASQLLTSTNSPDALLQTMDEARPSMREECIEMCYRTGYFFDIKFLVGNESLGARKVYRLHKLVLASQSPLFFALCIMEQPHPPDGFPIPQAQPEIFDHVVTWLYQAKVTVSPEDTPLLTKIYDAAEYLEIRELETKILEILKQRLDEKKLEDSRAKIILQLAGIKEKKEPEIGSKGVERESKIKKMFKIVMKKLITRGKKEDAPPDPKTNPENASLGAQGSRIRTDSRRRYAIAMPADSPLRMGTPVADASPNSSTGAIRDPPTMTAPTPIATQPQSGDNATTVAPQNEIEHSSATATAGLESATLRSTDTPGAPNSLVGDQDSHPPTNNQNPPDMLDGAVGLT
ncbi:hypothetical protein H072_201 [Dactylellina haptotyla CBS 200.50]|uniref:BTB domain-containing protein n=1 Tax=Dactylellina haptotyla (strain CBS 200.50) TaxID=1284197 RepID=S8AS18_DACHA|nr:hypothetical protein H072_201 [Dactylellina haptotyla CBS 200.50]